MPNFIDLGQIDSSELRNIIEDAKSLKAKQKDGQIVKPLEGKQLAMIFEKPSTRTRASFEIGMNQLGGYATILNTENTQLGRGESIHDTAKVLSRYVDLIMIRCFKHQTLIELADAADIPVINGLTDLSHPCQIMADIMTFEEHRGDISGNIVAWLGDGNNVLNSWIRAAAKFNFQLNIATPKEFSPSAEILDWAKNNGATVNIYENPSDAAKGANLVTTDTWFSMGDSNSQQKSEMLKPYQVNSEIMALADENSLFMHCLPAHRGSEVTDEVLDGKSSVIFDEAENRLHVQKSIMIWCLKKG